MEVARSSTLSLAASSRTLPIVSFLVIVPIRAAALAGRHQCANSNELPYVLRGSA